MNEKHHELCSASINETYVCSCRHIELAQELERKRIIALIENAYGHNEDQYCLWFDVIDTINEHVVSPIEGEN